MLLFRHFGILAAAIAEEPYRFVSCPGPSMSDPQWLIPFHGRNSSLREEVNFLWRAGALFVMDNHRLAPWCFWQHLEKAPTWRLLHIDRHQDTADDDVPWPQAVLSDHRSDLQGFCEARTPRGGRLLYLWDSVVSSVIRADRTRFTDVYMATGSEDGQIPDFVSREIDPWKLPWTLGYIVDQNEEGEDKSPWWIDVDLDYFTTKSPERVLRLCTDEYISKIGQLIWGGVENGRIGLVTVALSPETTGNWALAENLLTVLLSTWPHLPELP